MKNVFTSPLRVYVTLGALALLGLWSALQLSVSLYPNSSRPTVWVRMDPAQFNPTDFYELYGKQLESRLKEINIPKAKVTKVDAEYGNQIEYEVEFAWGNDFKSALQETTSVSKNFVSQLSQETQRSLSISTWNRGSGFFVQSFYSDQLAPDELYKLLHPLLNPKLSKIESLDTDRSGMMNPAAQELTIEYDPKKLLQLGLIPQDIEKLILRVGRGRNLGKLSFDSLSLPVKQQSVLRTLEDFHSLMIPLPEGLGGFVPLTEIAQVELRKKTENTTISKTSGADALLLFGVPKPDGNIKAMAESLQGEIKTIMKQLPEHVKTKSLVDPSQFINASIRNVFTEVALGASLAVLVLYLFIGSFKNVITAAIEIPISLILAFILMKFAGMSLNLISLGGLALASGMNVDASVVVMENIFRHLEEAKSKKLSWQQKVELVTHAVNEVKLPVIASTIASVVVFLPLVFTDDLSYAILGDLAKSVVFSHGLSAFVALILVPTVRLHMMRGQGSGSFHFKAPLEFLLGPLERFYGKMVRIISKQLWILISLLILTALVLGGLVKTVLPKLPKEIVGLPDTDRVAIQFASRDFRKISEMDEEVSKVDKVVNTKFKHLVEFTYSRVDSPGNGRILAKLHTKKSMNEAVDAFEKEFKHTPSVRFSIRPWNPSELPIPYPPHVQYNLVGSNVEQKSLVAAELIDFLESKKVFQNVWAEPNQTFENEFQLEPDFTKWSLLQKEGFRHSSIDILDSVRHLRNPKYIQDWSLEGEMVPIQLVPRESDWLNSLNLRNYPIFIGDRTVTFDTLFRVKETFSTPPIRTLNGEQTISVFGKLSRKEESKSAHVYNVTNIEVEKWYQKSKEKSNYSVTLTTENPQWEVDHAVGQLGTAVGWSVGLIFLTMLLQFGTVIEPLLILASVPFGFVGVLSSLFIFKSTLSLNAVLGVILLNGISVANSIILIDFARNEVAKGVHALDAVVLAATHRLRPILITSFTTILGMTPIALGHGEGGKILQPLGISVSGGLWVSMILTLLMVPSLHYQYLRFQASRRIRVSDSVLDDSTDSKSLVEVHPNAQI